MFLFQTSAYETGFVHFGSTAPVTYEHFGPKPATLPYHVYGIAVSIACWQYPSSAKH
jgi:hypothetical protein